MTENLTLKPKVEFLKNIFLFVGIVSFGLGLYRYQDNAVMGAIDFLLAIIILALRYYLNNHKDRIEIISSIALTLSYVFFTAIYLLAPFNKTRIALFFLLLASAFFLKGKKAGFIWLILILLTFVIVHFVPGYETDYSGLEIITGSLFLVALFFVLHNYETFIENVSRNETEQLRISDELLRQSQSVARLGSWRLTQQYGVLQWSDESYRIFGIPIGTPVNYDFFLAQVHPDDRARVDSAWQAAMKGGERYSVQHRIVVKGETRWIEELAVLNFDAQGNFHSGTGSAQDITKSKQAEALLLEAEWKFRALFEKGPIGVAYHEMIYDESGKPIDYLFIDANETYKKLTGVDPRGKTVKQAFPGIENDPFDWIGTFGHVARTGESKQFEQHLALNDNWYDCVAYQYKQDYFVVAFINTTERKRIEERLHASVLLLKEKELAKTRFLAAAGHDLRQPVAAANLFVDALKFTSPTPKQSELIERLDQSMSIFSGLLERLLDISKLDAGLVKPQIASFDLAELFNWLEQNFAQTALDRQLRFRLYFPMNKPLIIRTDIILLQSVLMNLVSNAIKFTARGGVLISARQRGDSVLLQVWDTGIGIEEVDLKHIFDEFYQVSNPQRNREAGLGLGLSICQRAMSLLGGEVTCRSQLGHGSVFELSLPLNGRPHEIESLPVKKPPAEIPNENLLRGQRVVLVEDDVLVAEGMLSLLQGMGAEVWQFYNAEEALKHDDLSLANFFIVDYALGGKLNGMQFLAMLQQRQHTPIRAVIVTGETSSQFILSINNSPWPVLHKPINYTQLITHLNY